MRHIHFVLNIHFIKIHIEKVSFKETKKNAMISETEYFATVKSLLFMNYDINN